VGSTSSVRRRSGQR